VLVSGGELGHELERREMPEPIDCVYHPAGIINYTPDPRLIELGKLLDKAINDLRDAQKEFVFGENIESLARTIASLSQAIAALRGGG
jgi:hypothetical protein